MAEEFSQKQCLVIDDFSDMRAAIRSILRSLGVNHIDQARDGNDAIAQMAKKRFDVVLCDYNLGPGKDGQQVLEEARHRQLIGIDCIFIMVTAENTREMVMSAAEYAPDSYLSKPFTKELLKNRLDKLFERKAHLAPVNKALVAKDYGTAIGELDQLIAASPKNLADLLKLKTEICLAANRYDEAMTVYEQVLAAREIAWARLGMGKVLYLKKHYAKAQEMFRQLIALDPNLIAASDWLARTQTALQQFAEAEETVRSAVKLSPRGLKRQQMLGELALSNGNSQEAEIAFGHAVTLAKHSVLNHPSLFANLARSKSSNNKHVEALKVIGEIGKVFSNTPEATFYKATATATVKQQQGDREGALEALQTAEAAIARFGEASHATLSLEMVKTYAQLGEQDKAAALLQKAIANNHDDEEFLMNVVQACREAGVEYDTETAIREIQQDVVKTNNLGVRLIKQGEFDAALELLHEAAEDMPGNKTINLNAAKASIMKMEKLGTTNEDIQLVRRYIGRVHALAPNDWRLNDVISRLRTLAPKV
ncbi:tetratricopeptide repeat-containing response regulator [uncultured Thiocystis sp.]|jgi:tetratricopeptide (TPR) repeat protein|uniref:tetratricopeptide repeat-containing response regulator n=1 Tax=uncultured Thiocystis sp. TaxID=1202134 RepID=UPI0025E1B124|nr:tetratricopeptide repeat-containing response regulator [uncultured Thiocystis sp.]